MALNFNTSPYYDDFDPNKNFHRILFKPGYAVQARELTQTQTILQDQISKFASHVFQKNTPISGGKLTFNTNCYYIKLNSTVNGAVIDVSDFLGASIQNAAGDVTAQVMGVAAASGSDPNTLVVTYQSGQQFQNGDIVYNSDNVNITAQVASTSATGKSSIASISEGVFYVVNGFNTSQTTHSKYSIGHFVNVQPQTVILSKYDSTPDVRVGLNISESIYDYVNDTSLLDPADGAPNYQAPGADRYVVKLTLETRPLQLGDDDGFIELMRIQNGQILKQVDGTVYATIDEYFAKRTYEESGDYIVNDFKVTPTANTSDSSLYDMKIGKGVAYVRGYRIENQGDVTLTSERARTTDTITNNSTFVELGNYLYVDGMTGIFDVGQMQSVDLHLVEKGNITVTNTTTYNTTLAATALIRNLDFEYYTDASNTATYVYKAYITEIENKTITGNVVSATSTTITLPGLTTSPTSNAYYGVTVSIDNGTSAGDVKRIVSYNGTTRTATVDSAFTVTPDTTSVFTLRFDVKDVESVVRSSGYTPLAWSKINTTTGKMSGISTGDTILNNKVAPELVYNLGYPYAAGITDASYRTTQIFRDVTFSGSNPATTSSINFPDTNNMQFLGTSDSNYIVIDQSTGKVWDASNTSFSLSNANKTLVVSVANASAFTGTIIAKASITDATQTGHFLKIKNLKTANTTGVNLSGTTINSNIKVSLPNGQTYIKNAAVVAPGQSQSLYVSDVKRIVKIIDTKSPSAPPTSAMLSSSTYDVTANYSFDNGQKDSYYGHSSIKLRPGRPKASGDLLVLFDYYEHTGGDGYFSVESYLAPNSTSPENYGSIPSYTAKNGKVYNLRDSLDFRPTVKNAQTSLVFDYTTDPTTTGGEKIGLYIPLDNTVFTEDYEYYLGRKDKLILTKDKNFEIVTGTPSINPIVPVEPDGALVIANLTLDPYTNYLPGENPSTQLPNLSLEKVQHRRWTMQDITGLQNRINNIEYYTALNALEKDAQSLQVPDVNGLNRFKHGILVDDFSSFATADTYNYDFNSAINRRERKLTASHVVDNFSLQSAVMANTLNKLDTTGQNFSVNVIGGTNIYALPYTSANLAQQVLASNTINLNPFATPIVQGVLSLNPPMDNWVDNTKQPDLLIVDPDLQLYQQTDKLNTLNVSDWNVIPGTTTTSTTSSQSGRTVTVTTKTFADLKQATTLGYYDKLGSSYTTTNGFITDISVLPYIRYQKLLFKAQGLLTNTPVSAFFDGVNVDDYVTVPDVIELDNVTGSFKPDDVIGYYSAEDANFYPIATVVDSYTYPGTTRTRLSVAGNYHSGYYANDKRISHIQNATFNADGTYKSASANGKITTSDTVAVHRTGQVSMVGGNFTDLNTNSVKYYKVKFTRYSPFSQKYSIWGNTKGTGDLPTGKFQFNVPTTGTYYVRYAFEKGEAATYTLKVNNVAYTMTNSYDQDFSVALTAGTANVEFGITSNSGADGDQHFALAISNKPWDAYTNQRTAPSTSKDGTIIFSTDSLWSSVPIGATSMSDMAGGGLYFTGVTQIALGGQASANDSFYVGSTMKVTSTYISVNAVTGANVKQTITQSANVINYIAANTTVILDSGVNVSYGFNSAVGGDVTSTYTLDGTHKSYKLAVAAGGLSKLSTDDAGNFVGVFHLPENTFKTGERIFRIDNRTTPNDSQSATTFAEATFTASGLATKSQAIEFSPSIDAAKRSFVQNSYQSQKLMNTTSYSYRVDPVAQTFIIEKDNYPNGAFLHSVKLFFYSKDTKTNSPVTLSIVGTENGYPNGETLDHSIVTVYPNDIKTSTTPHHLDSNTYTEFKFAAPVYIQPGVMYAMIVRSPSTAYNIYFAGQRGDALASTVKNLPSDVTPTVITKIGTMPYIGSLFESQNGITWTADQGKALMFKLERCKFDTSANPKLSFIVPRNLPYRKLVTSGVESYYDNDNVINHGSMFAGSDIESHSYNITTTDFVPSTTSLSYSYKSLYKSNKSYTNETKVTPGKFGCPSYDNLYLNDGGGERILVANSNSSFILYSTLSSTDDALSPVIADDALSLFNIRWNINNLELSNNTVTVTDGGTGYNVTSTSVSVSAPEGANGVQATASANISGGIIQDIYFTNVGSGYNKTPTITITDSATRSGNSNASIIVHGETSSSGGNGIAKYFTKRVVLTPGNDSGDLRVYYTAYRPYGTDINVYYKILNRNDSQPFEDGEWQLMTPISNGLTYSQSRADLYEYEWAPGTGNVADDKISYTSTNGQTYTQFAQFAIKVVMSTSDKTNVPFLTDIRALALPPGTGV